MKIIVLLTILITVSHRHLAAQETKSDSVTITFNVTVPGSTPSDDHVFWTGTLNRWDPGHEGSGFDAEELSKPAAFHSGIWSVQLTTEQGDTVRYKYTRGSIFSVEERADYTYLEPRMVVFDRNKSIRDTVEVWHDIPPKALEQQWPKVSLKPTDDLNVTYKGMPIDGSGTLLYDQTISSRIYDTDEWYTEITGIPETLERPVLYFQRVSYAPNNTVLVAAGKTSSGHEWDVYIDQNNDYHITHDELVFITADSLKHQQHTVDVEIQQLADGKPINATVPFTVARVTDLPPGHRSSAVAGAPNLTYELPFRNRVGELNDQPFYLSTLFELHFKEFPRILVDHNRNDTLEIGSGSNEVVEADQTQMYRQQTFFMHPSFTLGDDSWEVADVDREGEWIRLRPVRKPTDRKSITPGHPAPQWNAITIDGAELGSEVLQGQYVLLDFWGSWCGPCIEALPLLKRVYKRFRSRNFIIVGFAYESGASLQRALNQFKLPWPQVLDERGVYSTQFLVKGYPTYYLIGPDGKVMATGADLRGDRLVRTLEMVLEQE